MVGIKFAAGN